MTGGSRGIGRAIARRLARPGATVVVNYVRQRGRGRRDRGGHRAKPGARRAPSRSTSATRQPCARRSTTIVDREGRVDILVNNAGLAIDGLLLRLKDDDWKRVLQTQPDGRLPLHQGRGAHDDARPLRPHREPHLGRGRRWAIAGQAAYAAAKAGVVGFTRSLAREVASRGITVNAVAPGLVETDMAAASPDAQRDGLYRAGAGRARRRAPTTSRRRRRYLCSPGGGIRHRPGLARERRTLHVSCAAERDREGGWTWQRAWSSG